MNVPFCYDLPPPMAFWSSVSGLLGKLVGKHTRSSGTMRPKVWNRAVSRIEMAYRKKQFPLLDAELTRAQLLLESQLPGDALLSRRYNRLGELYESAAGNDARAEVMYRRAIDLSEQSRGVPPLDLIPPLNNLALLLLRGGRASEAEALLRRLLPLTEQSFGPDDQETATCLENLAAALRQVGQQEEAKELRSRASLIRRKKPLEKVKGA